MKAKILKLLPAQIWINEQLYNNVIEIARKLCYWNETEIQLLYGGAVSSYSAIMNSIRQAKELFILYDSLNIPKGIGGVQNNHCVWLVLTSNIDQRTVLELTRIGKKYSKRLRKRYKDLWGWRCELDTFDAKLLNILGFELTQTTKICGGQIFKYFIQKGE